MNSEVPKTPLIFDKPLSSLIKSGETMILRRENEIHHEIELGIVIKKQAKDVKSS